MHPAQGINFASNLEVGDASYNDKNLEKAF